MSRRCTKPKSTVRLAAPYAGDSAAAAIAASPPSCASSGATAATVERQRPSESALSLAPTSASVCCRPSSGVCARSTTTT
jgi:hypothetical protein